MSSEKRLFRSRNHKKIFGVCGGYADYFHIDPTWIRVVFIGLFVCGSAGLWIYLISAILMPKNPDDSPEFDGKPLTRTKGSEAKIFGVAGGIARYFDLDATVARIVCAILCLFGVGLVAYILLALILPVEA